MGFSLRLSCLSYFWLSDAGRSWQITFREPKTLCTSSRSYGIGLRRNPGDGGAIGTDPAEVGWTNMGGYRENLRESASGLEQWHRYTRRLTPVGIKTCREF